MSKGVVAFCIALVVVGAPVCGGAATDLADEGHESGQVGAAHIIDYTPPKRGMPGARIGGGSRGMSAAELRLVAIVPDHVALSARPDPTFCWYQAKPSTIKRLLVIDDGQGAKPMLEKEIEQPNQAGLQCLSVERFGVTLKAEVEYHWFIDGVNSNEHRSKDVVSGGAVLYKAPSPELADKIKGSSSPDLPPLLAANGYWYDAMASVMAGLASQPDDQRYLAMKEELLKQVGLPSY